MQHNIFIDTAKTVLSAKCRMYKTERFIKETYHFSGIDLFLAKLEEGVILNIEKIREEASLQPTESGNHINCFKIQTEGKRHSFYFTFGKNSFAESELPEYALLLFRYEGMEAFAAKNDRSLQDLLSTQGFSVRLSPARALVNTADFKKLYRLSNSDYVNFPLLNDEQRKIVYLEDQNVLVQGVAGSGKTNVCIDKIVFAACRSYMGRILYSTFSRGLLVDTHEKVKQFQSNLKRFVEEYEAGRVEFFDDDHKKAIENRLGIYFTADDDDRICQKVKTVIDFLDNNVDYFLLEDFYRRYISDKEQIVDEGFFVKKYVKNIKNHQLTSKLDKVSHLSHEVIYKEIFGVILGCYDMSNPSPMLSVQEYTEKRKNSFSRSECEIIHSLAKDYDAFLRKNSLIDNNLISRRLLELTKKEDFYLPSGSKAASPFSKRYSIAVLDEVQDMTEVNLCFIKSISMKLFCVGDALQMINPSYFSFAYLKRLLFEKDIASVAELANNYRNTKKIADIIDRLGQINMKQFGTHSFVLKGVGLESDVPTSTVYINKPEFINEVNKEKFNNYTVIVSGVREKEQLRKFMHKQEILTVAEVKGLERDVVILYNVLSSNYDKWKILERTTVNRKQADENSVFRYYFNLFYVGISRAKTHIYVVEGKELPIFKEFFKENFENLSVEKALEGLLVTSNKLEIEQDEILERVRQFISLEQFDNARFTAEKILSESQREWQQNKINVHEEFVHFGKHREAGIRFWELGMLDEAKKQFSLSGDEMLFNLIDACTGNDAKGLSIDIVDFFPDMEGNETARRLILDTVKKDVESLKRNQKDINNKLKKIKEKM